MITGRAGAAHGDPAATAAALLAEARALGADLVGVAAVEDLRALGSTYDAEAARRLGALPAAEPVRWPEGAHTVVLVAVEHPSERPELDWWFGRIDPPGNRVLARVVQGLCDWAVGELGLHATHLPYHVERGGIFLKDAAVLAGLGCVGLNNLVITPEFGPRIRLRALALDAQLPSTGPSTFDPCTGCDAPCRRACPQSVFAAGAERPRAGAPRSGVPTPAFPAPAAGSRLAARTGEFSRDACYVQMDLDIESATLGDPGALGAPELATGATLDGITAEPVKVVRYCRACELSCWVGR